MTLYPPLADIGSLQYQLGQLRLNHVDGSGVTWAAHLDGWDDTPPVTGGMVPRVDDDGADPLPGYLEPRPLTLTGLVVAPTAELAGQAHDQLLAECQLWRRDGTLEVHERVPKRAQVRVNGPVRAPYVSPAAFTFQAPLVASDPRKYSVLNEQGERGPTVVTTGPRLPGGGRSRTYPRRYPRVYTDDGTDRGGQVQVFNRGNAPTRPAIRVYGGTITDPRVVLVPGREITVARQLTALDELDIDTANQVVTLNGQPARRWTTATGDQWELPAGESVVRLFGTTASAAVRMRLSYRSAWI